MTSLKELEKWHGPLAHEFNRIARDEWGWCVIGSGFERLFKRRKGAQKILSKNFTPETLFTRSWPDYYLRGNIHFYFIEIKGPAHVSPKYRNQPRVRIEAFQVCLLHNLYCLTGSKTRYVFMAIDGTGIICPVENLPIEELCETETFREKWPKDLRDKTREMFHNLYPELPSVPVSDPRKGSGDPFLAFNKSSLELVGKPIDIWFSEHGKQKFTPSERVAWEGRKSSGSWKSYLPQRGGSK